MMSIQFHASHQLIGEQITMKASRKPSKVSVYSARLTSREDDRLIVFVRMALLLAAISCLAMAQSASAVSLENGGSTSQAVYSPPSTIITSTLSDATDGRIQTQHGTFSMSSDSRFYLRNAGAIKRVYDLSSHVGLPVQLMIQNEQLIWLVVETQEAIQ